MKRKDIKLLHKKTATELLEDIRKKQKELLNLELGRKVTKTKNTRLSQTWRDDLARIKTVLAEIQIRDKKGSTAENQQTPKPERTKT